MIKTVVRVHHWPPSEIERLCLHGMGVNCLMYWYYDIIEVNDEIKDKLKKTN